MLLFAYIRAIHGVLLPYNKNKKSVLLSAEQEWKRRI